MKIRVKVLVLNDEGEPYMGTGPILLLQGIERLGSINQAAKEMKMSYVKALKIIKKMEICLGGKILKTTIGGNDYGGSKLTDLARRRRKRRSPFPPQPATWTSSPNKK